MKVSIRDLRYHFSEVEARLKKGEEILVHKRRKMIAKLSAIRPETEAYPDFSAIRRRIFGTRKARKTSTKIVSDARGRY